MRQSILTFRSLIVAVATIPAWFGALPTNVAGAESNDETRIIAVEARLADLETRVRVLEDALRDKPSPSPAQDDFDKSQLFLPELEIGNWLFQGNWSLVKNGMSFDQVIRILGKPTRTDMSGADHGTWYYEGYSKEAGSTISGNVFFSSRRVLHIEQPVWQ